MKYLYHYTCVQHWQKIKDTGYLKLTESNLKSGLKDNGYWDAVAYNAGTMNLYKPVIWLTDKEVADKKKLGLAGSIVDKTEIKITIKKQPFFKSWLDWSRKNNINKEWAQVFEIGGEPKSWWVSELTIKLDDFLKVENVRTGEVFLNKIDK